VRRRLALRLLAAAALVCTAPAAAQELDPRSYSPAPIGTSFVLLAVGQNEGDIVLDPAVAIDGVEADLWFSAPAFGYTFDLAGRQARILAVLPAVEGDISAEVGGQPATQHLEGMGDPKFKLFVGLRGAPALTLEELRSAPKKTVIGTSLTVVAPWGDYEPDQLVNLGYNRWAFKPEVGVAHPAGRFTIEGYAGVWLFTANHEYFPAHVTRRQDPVVALQGHLGYAIGKRAWAALDATWFDGGETAVDGVASRDRQSNTRLGATMSLPVGRMRSLKLTYSTGAFTRRGSDYDTWSVTWQRVRF
jgi:hypothetical protein